MCNLPVYFDGVYTFSSLFPSHLVFFDIVSRYYIFFLSFVPDVSFENLSSDPPFPPPRPSPLTCRNFLQFVPLIFWVKTISCWRSNLLATPVLCSLYCIITFFVFRFSLSSCHFSQFSLPLPVLLLVDYVSLLFPILAS